MRRLAGVQLFVITVAHHTHVRYFCVHVSRMCTRAQCLHSALQFFTTLYSFLPFYECFGINSGPWMTSSLFDDVEFL
jgi:hypothetical protein